MWFAIRIAAVSLAVCGAMLLLAIALEMVPR